MTETLTLSALLRAWEAGAGQAPLDRALTVLWAAGVAENAADLPLAERDRRLLALRAATFGSALEAVATCPGCAAELEITLDAGELAASLAGADRAPGEALRALTSRDLAAAVGVPEAEIPALLRARLCAEAPAEERKAEIDRRIAEHAARCELTVALRCPDCNTGWSDYLDIADHLWSDIEAAAVRLLAEITEIAAAFGWSETEILAMSPRRRAVYLQIARAP